MPLILKINLTKNKKTKMKTTQLRFNRISILLSLTALSLLPLISNAQLKVLANGNVGMGTTNPITKLNIETAGSNDGIRMTQTSTTAASLNLNASTGHQWTLFSKGTGNTGEGTNFSIYDWTTGFNRIYILGSNGNVGIGTINPGAYKLYVNGNFNVNGTATCNSGAWTSDQQFKTTIDSISEALPIINQLKPRSFYFDTTNVYGLSFSNKKQYGLIAQDVEQVLPELVTSTTKPADVDTLGNVIHPAVTYKSVNYNAFIGIMLQGIKEQNSKNDNLETKTNNQDSIITSLQNQLNALASTINSCCNDNHDNGNHNGHHKATNNQTNVELNDAQTIVLEQNVPNPFAEQTAINYSLPDNTFKAQMLFYNAQGKLIQSTELTQKGKGTLNVFASDLSSGIYTYTLVVDGKIIETKKMVKQ